MSVDESGLSKEMARLLAPILEDRDAKTRRDVADRVIDRLTSEIGQALERVRAEFASPVKPAILFNEPLEITEPVAKLRLPRGITHRLGQDGFTTIELLQAASDYQLLDVRDVGPVALGRIDAHLDAAGFPRPKRGLGR